MYLWHIKCLELFPNYFSQTYSNLLTSNFIPVIFFISGAMFETLYVVFQFFDNLKQQSPHIENIYYLHFAGLLLLFLFFNHTRESMYDPPRLKVTL